jgi:hypothetical protein
MKISQDWLVLKKLKLAWTSGHEQKNDVLDPRWQVKLLEHPARLRDILSH